MTSWAAWDFNLSSQDAPLLWAKSKEAGFCLNSQWKLHADKGTCFGIKDCFTTNGFPSYWWNNILILTAPVLVLATCMNQLRNFDITKSIAKNHFVHRGRPPQFRTAPMPQSCHNSSNMLKMWICMNLLESETYRFFLRFLGSCTTSGSATLCHAALWAQTEIKEN